MRIRTIKPEFWSSLTIHELTPVERLTFIGIWNYADDEGRGLRDPRLLKASIWPLDDEISPDVVMQHVADIERVGLVASYQVEGRWFFQVRNWHEHQTISKPRPSTFPDETGTWPGTFPERSSLERKGREQGTGNREGKKTYAQTGTPSYPHEFEMFWRVYPLKKAKGAALRAWERAITRAPVAEILDGAQRYRDDPYRKQDFTKYAEGWLNADRWTDESTPAPSSNGNVGNILALADRADET